MDKQIIAKVQGFGFDVYMRKPADTYMIFTDGKNLGYLEDGRWGFTLTTVHKANKTTGTGYRIMHEGGDFTADDLRACFINAPAWAPSRDLSSIKKYRDIAEYIGQDSFHGAFQLVAGE